MQVSVETLNGLERKLTISVPFEKIEAEVNLRLRNMAPKAKVHGFRAGKVPAAVIKQRYSEGVRQDVAREMVQSTLFEALKANDLSPAGYPTVEPEPIVAGSDFKYTAVFEIFPEIHINELTPTDSIDIVRAEVADSDLATMLDNLRGQNKDWVSVSRAVQTGDKVVIDFKGFLGDEAFEGGSAEKYALEIGSGSMIPGFEDGLIGAKKDKPCEIKVTFPADYGHNALAGKEARFEISVHDVLEGQMPELNEAFAEKFNIKTGGADALKKDIKENMIRELERRVGSMNRNVIFDALLAKNKFDVPAALVDQEIEHLKHEMYHQIFGHNHSDDEKIPDFPRALFEEKAIHRVRLGLLFSEYVKKHEIIVEPSRVDAMIEKLASAYEDPAELRGWYKESTERRAEIEALVMEEIVSEKILASAKAVEKMMTYDQVVNPEKTKENKGA